MLGFDRPIYIQYGEFMVNAVQGDFGQSLRSREDALPLVLSRLPATFQLAISALILSLLIAIPLEYFLLIKEIQFLTELVSL